jgi:hypothetical protein
MEVDENGSRESELDQTCTPAEVYSALVDAKLNCSIRVFGSQLGLDPPDLDAIEQNSVDQPPKLLKVLMKCSERAALREGDLRWSWIVGVLRRPALREYRVANQIEQQYLMSMRKRRQSSISSSLTLSPLSDSTSSTDYVWPSPTQSMEIG